MPKLASEFLAIADAARFRIADAAGGEQDIVRKDREVARFDCEAAVGKRVYGAYRAVGDDRNIVVTQQISEGMDDGRGLAVGRKHPRIGHAAQGDIERFEASDDFSRRAFSNRPFDKCRRAVGIARKPQVF